MVLTIILEKRKKLKEVIDVTKIDYLVTSHTEPDSCGECGWQLGLQSPDEDTGHSLCH